MAKKDLLTGAIDAGRDATTRTQDRVETLVRELVQTNTEQLEQAQRTLSEVVDRSRRTSERWLELIQTEVTDQISALRVATHADVRALEERVAALEAAAGITPPAKKTAAKKTAAKKTAAKKTAAKKTAAKKAAPKAAAG